jgi:pentatricopeptide repeat protein
MRLSRRHRTGASPPTSVTYAHAISACQKAETPDVDSARLLLKWARDDAIEPTVFMYASAIWTAERSSNCAVALELFDEMKMVGCSPNAVAYDGVISAVSKQGNAAQAIALYEKMKSDGLKPTLVTYKVSRTLITVILVLVIVFIPH